VRANRRNRSSACPPSTRSSIRSMAATLSSSSAGRRPRRRSRSTPESRETVRPSSAPIFPVRARTESGSRPSPVPGLWHEEDSARFSFSEYRPLDWKPPFPARYRADLRRAGPLRG
jgi:hypothetical protein